MSTADDETTNQLCPACERELQPGTRARLWQRARVHPACYRALRARYQVAQGLTYSSQKPSTYGKRSSRPGRMS